MLFFKIDYLLIRTEIQYICAKNLEKKFNLLNLFFYLTVLAYEKDSFTHCFGYHIAMCMGTTASYAIQNGRKQPGVFAARRATHNQFAGTKIDATLQYATY